MLKLLRSGSKGHKYGYQRIRIRKPVDNSEFWTELNNSEVACQSFNDLILKLDCRANLLIWTLGYGYEYLQLAPFSTFRKT